MTEGNGLVNLCSIGALVAICNCSALKAHQECCGLPEGFVLRVLWSALPLSSSAPPAHSALHGCSGGTCHLTPCNVFPGKIFFQLSRSKQLMVSCNPSDLHFSFLYAAIELSLLNLLWASTWWVSPQHALRYSKRNGEVKTADLLLQISSKSRLWWGSSSECYNFNCSSWSSSYMAIIFKSLYYVIPAMWRCATNLLAQAQNLFTHPFPRWW